MFSQNYKIFRIMELLDCYMYSTLPLILPNSVTLSAEIPMQSFSFYLRPQMLILVLMEK